MVSNLVASKLSAQSVRTDDYATPGELALALDPTTVQTPALDIIDGALVDVEKALDATLKRQRLFAKYRNAGMNEFEARDSAEAEVPTIGTDRMIVSMPPQEGKSERCSHYGVLWMLRRHPEMRCAIVSYEERIAQNMSSKLRNDLLTFDGAEGNIDLGIELRRGNRAVGSWSLEGERGSIYAIGIGGALTGRPVDLLVVDDPVKDYKAADSSLQSDQAWMWWMSVARARLAPGAPVIVILTRWHEADMAGRLIQKQREDEASEQQYFDRWRVINISAQAEFDPATQTDPLGRQPGEFMDSARGRTRAQWEATKASQIPRVWSALYQGKPSPDSGDVFHRNWWMRFGTPIWNQNPDETFTAHDCTEIIQSWDLAFKDNNTSDYVVGQVWARRGANTYLLDQVHARLSFTDTVAAIRRMSERWPQAIVKLIEDKANGPAVINALRSEVGGIIPVQVKDSKSARAAAVSPFIESNNVFLPSTEIALYDVEAFIEETTQFPNAAHDDQVDAMTQALNRFYLQGSGAKDWLESLAPTHDCGQPNSKGSTRCSKCGEELKPDETVDAEPEEFSLTSGINDPTKPKPPDELTGFNKTVSDAIAQYGPSGSGGFDPFARKSWQR